jgi:HEPN domain-containing protein
MNETVREWVAKAEADYATATRGKAVADAPNNDVICFLCQQCIEKLMKAILVDQSTVSPRTHDLVELHRLLTGVVPQWSWDETQLQTLSLGAVDYRYPGESADAADAAEAFDICTRAQESLRKLLGE